MSKKSRDKGRRGELELASLLEGERSSQTGLASPDIIAGSRFKRSKFEVKRRKQSFSLLYSALEQAREYGSELVAVRDDRKEWLIVMPLSLWMKENDQSQSD